MRLPFISHSLCARGCSRHSQAMAHFVLTSIARNCHVPILQMRKLKLKENRNQLAELRLKFRSNGAAFNNDQKCGSSKN